MDNHDRKWFCKQNQIGEISHVRTRTPNELLTETELSILRSEMEKLTRIARMDRPDLTYDVFDAAQISPKGKIVDVESEKKSPQEENKAEEKKEGEGILAEYLVFFKFPTGRNKRVNNVMLSGVEIKKGIADRLRGPKSDFSKKGY